MPPKKSKAASQGRKETSVSNDGSVIQLRVRKAQRRRFDHVPKDLGRDIGQKYVDSKRNPKFVDYILQSVVLCSHKLARRKVRTEQSIIGHVEEFAKTMAPPIDVSLLQLTPSQLNKVLEGLVIYF